MQALLEQHGWRIQHHEIPDNGAIGRIRRVTIAFRPSLATTTKVIYCADGQVVESLALGLARSPHCERLALIGVHSNSEVRAQEYLLSSHELFSAHERFFTEQVRSWAGHEFGVPTERDASVVFGFSNGGAFAFATALRRPRCFAAAISFSTPRLASMPAIPPRDSVRPSIYLAVGNQGPEKSIRKNVLHLARWLRQNDVPVTLCERRAGHALDFWTTELVAAVDWLCM